MFCAASEWRAAKLTVNGPNFNFAGLDEIHETLTGLGFVDMTGEALRRPVGLTFIPTKLMTKSQTLAKDSAQELAKAVEATFSVNTGYLEPLFSKGASTPRSFTLFNISDGELVDRQIVYTAKVQLVRVEYQNLFGGMHRAEVKAVTASAKVTASLPPGQDDPDGSKFAESRQLTSDERSWIHRMLWDQAFPKLQEMCRK